MTTPRTLSDALSSIKRRLTLVERRLSLASGGGSGAVFMASSAAERDARYPSPFQGLRVIRLDKGWEEMYYETYNSSTNPGGATPAGWYPFGGDVPKLVAENKGVTITTSAVWALLNTGFGDGQTYRNDGFTWGVGNIDVPYPGIYHVEATVRFSAANTGDARLVRLYGDEVNVFSNFWLRMASGGTWSSSQVQSLHLSGFVQCASTFSLGTYQNSGSNNNVLLQDIAAEFRGVRRV